MANKTYRKEIYTKALENLETGEEMDSFDAMWAMYRSGLCELISMAEKNITVCRAGKPSKEMVEFWLFEPTEEEKKLEGTRAFWWDSDNREVRKIALELMIAMCKK